MKMPVLDGWHFARTLRARHARVPPLVVTTAAVVPDQRARDVGVVAVVEKPFLLEDVQAALRRALASSPRQPTPPAAARSERAAAAEDDERRRTTPITTRPPTGQGRS
ncbi:MAG: response regulator [Deltaproteobacteria bacterium]|nr:response regulator [Deltaproteobacteria bacterium]